VQYLTHWLTALLAVTSLGVFLSLNRSLATRISKWTSGRNQSRWLQNIRRCGRAYTVYRDQKAVLVLIGLLSLVEQFFPIFGAWILSHALSASVTFRMLIIAVPLTLFVSRLPIAMSGIGAAEGTLVYLLGLFGVPSQEALALALACTALNIVTAVPGLLFWADAMHSVEAGVAVSESPPYQKHTTSHCEILNGVDSNPKIDSRGSRYVEETIEILPENINPHVQGD
jgi:uncharacterized membrane protein YbhN (UPF0104 family)